MECRAGSADTGFAGHRPESPALMRTCLLDGMRSNETQSFNAMFGDRELSLYWSRFR